MLLPLTDNLLRFAIRLKQQCLFGDYHLLIISSTIKIGGMVCELCWLSVNGTCRSVCRNLLTKNFKIGILNFLFLQSLLELC